MSAATAEDLYQLILQLSASERLRLVEKIVHDLTALVLPAQLSPSSFDWTRLAGVAPGLLGGKDAQEWVSESRGEADRA